MEKESTVNSKEGEKLAAEELNVLRQKIADIKAAEMERKNIGREYNFHFNFIDSDKLADEDLEIFVKFRNKTLKKNEFTIWRNSVADDSSSWYFSAWMGGKLQERENMEWFDPVGYGKLMAYLRKK